jgi:hypothetical protein
MSNEKLNRVYKFGGGGGGQENTGLPDKPKQTSSFFQKKSMETTLTVRYDYSNIRPLAGTSSNLSVSSSLRSVSSSSSVGSGGSNSSSTSLSKKFVTSDDIRIKINDEQLAHLRRHMLAAFALQVLTKFILSFFIDMFIFNIH